MNVSVLIGNTGRDVDIRYMPSGDAVSSVSLAVNEKFTVNGEKREKTLWIKLKAFGKTAELFGKYVKQGDRIGVRGKLELEKWEARDGGKRSEIVLVVQELTFLGGNRDGNEESNGRAAEGSRRSEPEGRRGAGATRTRAETRRQAPAATREPDPFDDGDDFDPADDEIPF